MNLDPMEVLHHLQILGYRNISEKQLSEFIRDLKKLIKYDLSKRKNLHEDADGGLEVDQSKENIFPNNNSVNYRQRTHSKKLRNSEEDSRSFGVISSAESARSLDSPGSSSTGNGNITCGTDMSPKKNARKLPAGKIAHPSYIRSWHTNKKPNLKNDPVARYQWYQSQWNNLKVPGEEAHSQLRWLIRERMLGEDPNPRPVSWMSGRCSRNSVSNLKYHPR